MARRSSASSAPGKGGGKVRKAGVARMRPTKLGSRTRGDERRPDEGGPLEWVLPMLESPYVPLCPRGAAPVGVAMAMSSLQTAANAMAFTPGPAVWRDTLLEYKQRKAAALGAGAPESAMALAKVPGARNWNPLGPSVVLNGQTVGKQPVAGRVAGLAIAPGGSIVYAASANGGVFRSDDGATSWRSLMDGFDIDPASFASASVICGAIALAPSRPDRVYVGTGEGDTLALFRRRVTGALPAYRGVGVLSSDDGGATWVSEASIPDLAGEAFFSMAVDAAAPDVAIAGTTQGLYRRTPSAGGQHSWQRIRSGTVASVAFASSATVRRFYCAHWDDTGAQSGVFYSDDGGVSWARAGGQFPTTQAGRITLGVSPQNPDLVYAYVAARDGALLGVYRLDAMGANWRTIANPPDVLPGRQGQYDLSIAVDPQNVNLIYLAGDRMTTPPWGGSIWRCAVQLAGGAYQFTQTRSIGTHAHADVHVLAHTPNDSTELWCGGDGGVFLNRDPVGTGEFSGQNNGLSCLCCNFLAQHPTDPNILFVGLQDNGTARTSSGPIWTHVGSGDGGYCLINWADPKRVLIYANGVVSRSTNGGVDEMAWQDVWKFGWATMTQPVVGPAYDPAHPADAELLAVGAGQLVYISQDFATSWAFKVAVPGGVAAGDIFALAWASRTRVFAATTNGHVFRLDRNGASWMATRIDNVAAAPLGLTGLVTDIAVDWADATLRSVYLSFGGMGDRRRIWRFDGTGWAPRSGVAGATGLMDVEHNAIAVDRVAPQNLYVGADIGVWHSPDGGQNWNPLENGLPDAPVFDLQIHPTQRLLRASLHGRGVYELPL